MRRTIRVTLLAGTAAVAVVAALLTGGPAGAVTRSGSAADAACAPGAGHPVRRAEPNQFTKADAAKIARDLAAHQHKQGRRATPFVIPVRAHVLKSTNSARPYATATTIEKTIAKLNQAYSGAERGAGADTDTGFQFRLYDTSTTTNTDWAWAEYGSRAEYDMKRALFRGHAYALNLYFVNQRESLDILGYSTFPWEKSSFPRQDGVVLNVRALPSGGNASYPTYTPYAEGDTAVHEVGHWLGLLHTFEGGCAAPGDYVTDTPREQTPTAGCPRTKNTCPAGPSDPIHNFMDYSYDACMYQFTAGQSARMDDMWVAYRAP